jgi:hypothetical protein
MPDGTYGNEPHSVTALMDVIFLDNECASLLTEEPLRSQIKLKAKIFSQLSLQTPEAVRERASEIYGI